jgi:hypothetical protein
MSQYSINYVNYSFFFQEGSLHRADDVRFLQKFWDQVWCHDVAGDKSSRQVLHPNFAKVCMLFLYVLIKPDILRTVNLPLSHLAVSSIAQSPPPALLTAIAFKILVTSVIAGGTKIYRVLSSGI